MPANSNHPTSGIARVSVHIVYSFSCHPSCSWALFHATAHLRCAHISEALQVTSVAVKISAMRSLAFPSQKGGTPPFFTPPRKILHASFRNRFESCPTRIFVPIVTVTGRSVLSRTVRHG